MEIEYDSKTGETKIAPDIDPVTIDESRIEALRQAYRDATRALCRLAGQPECDKLEDAEYAQVVGAAYVANPAQSALNADTLLYTLQTLRLDDGRDAWDRI